MAEIFEVIGERREKDIYGSFGYHSRVSTRHKYVCMTVPKVACSRIKLTLNRFEGNPEPEHIGGHSTGPRLSDFSTEEIAEMFLSKDWLKFCLVRNPYTRLLSAYRSQIGNIWNDEYAWVKEEAKKAHGYPENEEGTEFFVAFRDFVRYLETAPLAVQNDGHFTAQANILMPDVISYDMVGRFEDFSNEFRAILKWLEAPPEITATTTEVFNPTYPLYPAVAYDPELADSEFRYYQQDFSEFVYDPRSWMFGWD